ncbi:iron uptake porin [Trichocoleus desertorum AS-A10]|uniref:iron uptake porin n=1 Tax=Trichocoleus desertorum TaxID=1481672 RepID=UPI003297CBEE
MSKIFWNSLLITPAVLGATLVASLSAIASEAPTAPTSVSSLDQPIAVETSDNGLAQVTSVSQLSDVQPTDWAFQALQSLVERYGCIAGYPDGTYRGNRALTRYEFAAGVNSCLDRINELIAAGTADLVSKEDLATLQRLQEEFSAELATLRGRVDALEARTAELEANQFSTTTKLTGEAIFAVTNAFGDQGPGGAELDDETALSDRVRLNLDTSFTGKDRLRTRLQAVNVPEYGTDRTGTNMTRLGFDGEGENDVNIQKLFYRFPLGDNTNVILDATGAEFYENIDTINPLFTSSGSGSISRFGRFNPIYRQGSGGAGLTVNTGFGKAVSVSLGYLADNPQTPSEKAGLFDGPNAALAQVAFRPFEALSLGFTYVRAYDPGFGVELDENGELVPLVNVTSSTGSRLARRPFGNVATATDNFGVEANFRLGSKISLGGWVGYTEAHAQAGALEGSDAEIWNWAANVGFTDLGKEGSLLGVIVGMPPKLTDVDGNRADDADTSLHLEALYRYPVNDNIDITPGLLVIFNPEHNDANDTIYVGTLRTTFKF